jgi:hypothetical protein
MLLIIHGFYADFTGASEEFGNSRGGVSSK